MNSGLGRCFGMGGLQGHHVFLWFAGVHNKRNHIFKLCFPSDHLFQHDLSEEGEMVSHTAMVSFSAMHTLQLFQRSFRDHSDARH